ncbi:glycosyl hydrolase family 76 [Pedobacter frigiditerrae]|uniref:Glycosyl hydrolase family 76 n=1 Tax=Pedobacter frigiditerrae TaxID=2530452 RepID=A0A4R0MMH1_9SPHI|nr:glycoside hydrolase family 76 protein [Pedobacter frigiditerrae]TCC87929.1 glycosyl hydrolase family 76 [Pedobacter frigiditerrae]
MKSIIKKIKLIALVGLAVTLFACKKETKSIAQPEPVITYAPVNFAKVADAAQIALDVEFYNQTQNYYNQNNTGNSGFNYWWNAHALDVQVDAYNRTKDPKLLLKMKTLLNGCYVKNGNTYKNTFYDDMEWWALACLRAYDATGDVEYKNVAEQLWIWIKVGWTTVNNGGIMWATGSPTSKNACSNAPAAIIAARLYKINNNADDLVWAKKIYSWMKSNLVESARGLVWDGYGNTAEGMILTYNQGTWLGAGLELYLITNEKPYLDDAVRNANYVMNDQLKFSPNGILKGENTGDGGLFKGIFIRYMAQLLLKNAVDPYTKELYVKYLKMNGESLCNKALKTPENVFGNDWVTKPSTKNGDASVQLSAVMLLETLDELKRAGILTN